MKRITLVAILTIFFITSCIYSSKMKKNSIDSQPLYVPNEDELHKNPFMKEAAIHNKTSLDRFSSSYKSNVYFNKRELLAMINAIRVSGTYCAPATSPLRLNKYLEQAAISHARDMALNNFLSHIGSGTSSDPARKAPGVGSNFMERIIFFGYPMRAYDLVGENVTLTKTKRQRLSIKKHFQKALKLYVEDPPHCKILMNPRFRDVGIGVYKKGKKYYWVMDLGEIEK